MLPKNKKSYRKIKEQFNKTNADLPIRKDEKKGYSEKIEDLQNQLLQIQQELKNESPQQENLSDLQNKVNQLEIEIRKLEEEIEKIKWK